MQPIIVFVIPIIRLDFIDKALETLYQYTDNKKFKVIVVDQSIEGWKGKADVIIRQKNQGFAQAANTGIRIALSWGVPYISVMNDDLIFIYPTWLEDALEEFKTDPKIIAVNPECPKVPMWGYGLTNGEYVEILPYKEQYSEEDIAYLKAGDYNKEEIIERHSFKIPESFPFTKRGVVDGIAAWLPIFKREGLIEKGLYDERFIPGSGEDYDWNGRVYSCAWPIEREVCDPKFHRRAVSTMRSWVWHFWGQSKDKALELDPRLFEHLEGWNHLDLLWPAEYNGGKEFDIWAHYDSNGIRKPFKRIPEVKIRIP